MISLAITRTLKFIHLAVKEHNARQTHTYPEAIQWTPPKISFKINIDGSFNNTKRRGTRCVLLDTNGNWIAGSNFKINTSSVTGAEILSMSHGLQLARRLNIQEIEICTDSIEIIIMLKFDNDTFFNIHLECMELVHQLGSQKSNMSSENKTK